MITARGMWGRDHFSRHYKSVALCEWRAGEVRYIIVCTLTCTASTASAGLHGGLFKPLARGCQYMREHYNAVGTFFFPTAVTVMQRTWFCSPKKKTYLKSLHLHLYCSIMHYFVFGIYVATYAAMFMRCKLCYIPIGNVAASAVRHATHNLPETYLTLYLLCLFAFLS